MKENAGAIFDLDGTILDSMALWNGFGHRFLASCGVKPRPDLDDIIHTLSIWEAAAYFQEEYGIQKPAAQIVDEINHMLEEEYFYHIRAKEGAGAFLKLLQERGIKMCVATATDRYQVEAALKREGLLEYFEAIFTCSEVGEGKQSPRIYLQALERLHTPLRKTWVFEDMLSAVKTAVKAGFPVVAIQDFYALADEKELRELATHYSTSYGELGDYFQLTRPAAEQED